MGLKKITVGMVIVIAMSMSGCSFQGSVAATVNGQIITEAALASTVRGIEDVLSDDERYQGFDFTAFMLENLVYSIIFPEVRRSVGVASTNQDREVFPEVTGSVGVASTDQDREEWWESHIDPAYPEYPLWADPRTRTAMAGYIDISIIEDLLDAGDLDPQTVVPLLTAMPVSVNPRYGTWDWEYMGLYTRRLMQPQGPLAEPVVFTQSDG